MASTSTKDPSFSDVKYLEALIDANTINTHPLKTMDTFRYHGKVVANPENNLQKASPELQE